MSHATDLFADPATLPLQSIADLTLSPVLVVAPHPDDEALGCGGLIALLRSRGCEVRVLVISDGTQSHPRSRNYPAPQLRALREAESRAGLAVLGVEGAIFLQLPDGAVPQQDSPERQAAVAKCRAQLSAIAPQLVVLPWRQDPHPDHRASWQLLHLALAGLPAPRVIEYPIWDWDPTQRGLIAPTIARWRLDIAAVLPLKRQAIAAYRSQVSDLIDDDPTGFRLSEAMLAHFLQPWEIYFEDLA